MAVRGAKLVRAFRGTNRAEMRATIRKLQIILDRDTKQPATNKILTDAGRTACIQIQGDLNLALVKKVPKF